MLAIMCLAAGGVVASAQNASSVKAEDDRVPVPHNWDPAAALKTLPPSVDPTGRVYKVSHRTEVYKVPIFMVTWVQQNGYVRHGEIETVREIRSTSEGVTIVTVCCSYQFPAGATVASEPTGFEFQFIAPGRHRGWHQGIQPDYIIP
jgi:hypothetical protein